MLDQGVIQVGGRLQAVRDFLRGRPAQKGFQAVDLLISSVAFARHGDSPPRVDVASDTWFVGRILLGILQRGHASFVSPFVEHSLLDECICSDFLFDEYGLTRQLDTETAPEGLADRLIAALLSPEPGVLSHELAATDSETEVIFLRNVLPPLLGGAVALVEPQRPLPSMLEDDLSRSEFIDRRVDFALQTPSGTKLVFEVDGKQHGERRHAANDQRRDHALREAGWIVERIPAFDVLRGHVTFSDRVRDAVAKDRTIRAINQYAASSDGGLVEERAWWLALAPHAVARIQLGILLAMLEGRLTLDAPRWTIGVIERDMPVAEVAVIDLHQQMTHLCALYGLGGPPRICLPIARTHSLPVPEPPWFPGIVVHRLSWQAMRDLEADVLIDVSVRTRPGDLRGDDPLPPAFLDRAPVYELRTAYRRLPEEALPWPAPRMIGNARELEAPLTYFLQLLFRKEKFREKQLDIIARAFERRDVLGLLPTGGGKSLTFQLPTLLSPGVTIVVAPLRSLIDDQIDNLHRAGINRAVGIHGGQSIVRKRQSLDLIAQGHPRFVYIAPERFHIQSFRDEIQSSMLPRSAAYVVVDEAHCVSEWGHDFRPAYLSVADQARRLFRQGADAVPIIALTATASETVLIDIQRELDFDPGDDESLVSIDSFDRPELKFLPLTVPANRKEQTLGTALERIAETLGIPVTELMIDPRKAGVVFCRYVNGRFGVWGVREALCRQTAADRETIRIFAGSQPKSFRGPQGWDDYKQRVQRDFKENAFPLLVATSSFGMGIDKPNIRYTVHYGIPHSVEALAQEAGRAGRDGKQAACAILFTQREPAATNRYLDPQRSRSEVESAMKAVPRHEQDDAYRVMFLHTTSYPGVVEELAILRSVFARVQRAWVDHRADGSFCAAVIPRTGDDDKHTEKAVYRLGVLGAVEDYTVDYNARTVTIYSSPISPEEMEARLAAFIARYDTVERVETVLGNARARRRDDAPYDHVLETLCAFIYDVIAKARREAVRSLVQRLEEAGDDGEALSRSIEIYLSRNIFTSAVARLVERLDIDEWFAQLAQATSAELARRLVAACQRQLESYPTHPGLHLLVGMGMLRQARYSHDAAASHILTALRSYTADYGATPEALVDLVRRVLEAVRERSSADTVDDLIVRLVSLSRDDQIARAAYPFATEPEARRLCAVPWLRSIARESRAIRHTAQESV